MLVWESDHRALMINCKKWMDRAFSAERENSDLMYKIKRLQDRLGNGTKVEKDTMSGTWSNNVVKLTEGAPFEVVNAVTGKFLAGYPGAKTQEEAEEKAREILKADPSLTLYVYAPVKVMTADIPITVEDFKPTDSRDID